MELILYEPGYHGVDATDDNPMFQEPFRTMYDELVRDLTAELTPLFPMLPALIGVLVKEVARLRVISVAGDRGATGANQFRDTRALLKASQDLVTKLSKMQPALAGSEAMDLATSLIDPLMTTIRHGVEDQNERHALMLAISDAYLVHMERWMLSRGHDLIGLS